MYDGGRCRSVLRKLAGSHCMTVFQQPVKLNHKGRVDEMKKLLVGFALCLVFAWPGFAQADPPSKPGAPVATVNGQPIYEQELMSVAGASLLELQKQEFAAKSEALDKLIGKKLLEAEAKKKGLTTEELLKREVDSKIAEPSDDEAKGYYLGAKNQTSLSFDEIKSQVKELLKR